MKLYKIFEKILQEQPTSQKQDNVNYGIPNKLIVPNTISTKGLDSIKSSEGFKEKPYVDSKKKIVIGYGTTLPNPSYRNKTITEKEGEQLLLNHLSRYVFPVIKKYVKIALTQNEFDALCSLIYNIGINAFIKSDLLSLGINKRDTEKIKQHWDWLKAYGRKTPVEGLVTRREKEKKMFFGK